MCFNAKFIGASNSIPACRWNVLMVNNVTVIGCWEIQNMSEVSDMRYPALHYRQTLGVSVSVPLNVSTCSKEFQLRA